MEAQLSSAEVRVSSGTYRQALYRWLERCDVRDELGQRVHLTPHQWRHTLGTILINRDVPQHVVQKILDHDSAEMTAHYARLSDKTVREHWERARKVNAEGQPVQISPGGPLGDAAWSKQRLSRATQALPNGYCELPMVRICPHANSCLTCPMFVTTAEFLPHHHAQRQATLQIITAAEAAGHARVAEMNRQVAGNLDKIIATLEDEGPDEKEAATGASRPALRCRSPAARADPVKGDPGTTGTRPGRHSGDIRRRRPDGEGLAVVALYPARHQQPDPPTQARDKCRRLSRRRPGRPAGHRCVAAGKAHRRPGPQQVPRGRERQAPPPARLRTR